MNVQTLKSFFGWCTVIDYGILLLWTLVFMMAHDWHFGMTSRFFHITAEQYDLVSFGGIAFFKILIMMINLVPYIALSIIGRAKR